MWKDILFSLRGLRRNPLLTATAVLSLALGIGANTAIFSLLQQVVLRSLPVQDPERLVAFHTDNTRAPGSSMQDTDESVFSNPLYRDLVRQDRAFSGIVARSSAGTRLAWHGATEAARAELVSGNFFQVLGVAPAAGRVLQPSDDGAPGANPVVVLRYGYWQTRFGGSREIVNQPVSVNGSPMVVVGVAAPEFQGIVQGTLPDIFVPISAQKIVIPILDILNARDMRWLVLFGRLAPGMTVARAQSITDGAYRGILDTEQRMKPTDDAKARGEFLNQRVRLLPAAKGVSELRSKWEKPLDVLMVMVGIVLLIACANVAGLLTARAAGRRREISIRLALGAGRGALLKQLLTEGLMLSLAGALVGLLVEDWCSRGLVSLLPGKGDRAWASGDLNPGLLAFSLAVAVFCGVLFSLIPALQATRLNLASSLTDRSAQSSTSQARLRRGLVTSQIALATLLAAGAGLFTISLTNMLKVNLGYRTERMLNFNVNATLDRPATAAATAFYQDLIARLAAVPGVEGVAAAEDGPFGGGTSRTNMTVEGYHPAADESLRTTVVQVNAGYFRVMGIPLVAGREFDSRERAGGPKGVLINESFAKRYFAGRNPVGQHMMFGGSAHPVFDREILGVAADSRISVLGKPDITVYLPYVQWEDPARLSFYVRAAGDEGRATRDILATVHAADPDLPAPTITTMDGRIQDSLYVERLIAILSGGFGILAALLAAIGVYGMMANAVARRTNEIGLRMALGAQPTDVRRMVLREAAQMVVFGLAIGLGAALGLGRLVESQLYGVRAADPMVLGSAAVLLAVIGLTAAAIPGWRASRIDPLVALRYE